MISFTTPEFIEAQQNASKQLTDEGWQREAYLGKVINIHLLGAYMQDGYTVVRNIVIPLPAMMFRGLQYIGIKIWKGGAFSPWFTPLEYSCD